MGMQGWSCGFRLAQQLGKLPPDARFSLDVLPERQSEVIAARLSMRARRAVEVVAVAAALVAVAWLRKSSCR